MTPYTLKVIRELNTAYPEGNNLKTPTLVAQYLNRHVFKSEDSWREQMYVLTTDSNANITGVFLLSTGSNQQTTYDKRLVVKAALDTLANGVILAHNHPTGNPVPSQADIRETEQTRKALIAFGVNLIDHIILGDKSFFSFAEEKVEKII